jgi:ubiquitin-conjugating enzyme E2 C
MALPIDLLRRRVKNELYECERQLRHYVSYSDKKIDNFPLEVLVTLVNTPAPVWKNNSVSTRYTHKLRIIITDEYPYQTPIVRWRTAIFHPNIMMPSDGGYVCTRLLDNWSFGSNLLSFIKGLETLLGSPNPDNPYESDSCTRAAEYFNKNKYTPPDITPQRKRPVIIDDDQHDQTD